MLGAKVSIIIIGAMRKLLATVDEEEDAMKKKETQKISLKNYCKNKIFNRKVGW